MKYIKTYEKESGKWYGRHLDMRSHPSFEECYNEIKKLGLKAEYYYVGGGLDMVWTKVFVPDDWNFYKFKLSLLSSALHKLYMNSAEDEIAKHNKRIDPEVYITSVKYNL